MKKAGKKTIYSKWSSVKKVKIKKSDWIMWTAAMSSDKETFQKFSDPVYKYINETVSRVPISDWHHTDSGKWVGFRARSVIGGYWMKVLMDKVQNNQ